MTSLRLPRPTPRGAVLAGVLVTAALAFSLRPAYEPDLWWHLAQGREAAARGPVHTNVFGADYAEYRQTYTPWLSEVLAYALYTSGGGAAIQLAQAALLALTFALLYLACRQRVSAAAAFSALALGLFVFEARALPRPYLVTFAGVAACVYLVERVAATGRARPLMWAVPLVALWSNLHVGSAFGVMVLGLVAAGELAHPAVLSRREAVRALAIATASLAAMLVTPYGWGIFKYLVENTTVPRVLVIAELQPPYLPTYRAFYVLLSVAGLSLAAWPRAIALREVFAGGAVVYLGLTYLRLTPLAALVLTPMLAVRFDRLLSRGLHPRALVVTTAAVAIATVPFGATRFVRGMEIGGDAVVPPAYFSTGAVAFIRSERLTGPVFNSNNLGGFLAWHLYPDVHPFQDGRLQAWPPEHFSAILAAAGSEDRWNDLVRGVNWAVLSRRQTHELSGTGHFPPPAWQVVYEDEAVRVVVRRDWWTAR